MPDLTRPPITADRLEETTLNLWHEFLSGFFDGSVKNVRGNSILFPSAQLLFQQAPQPQQNLSIQVVWNRDGRPTRADDEQTERKTYIRSSFQFYLRAKGSNDGSGGPEITIRSLIDKLFLLLSDKELTLPLARKGITHIRPNSPLLLASTDYVMRSVLVRTVLRFDTNMGIAQTIIPGGIASTGVFGAAIVTA